MNYVNNKPVQAQVRVKDVACDNTYVFKFINAFFSFPDTLIFVFEASM